MRKRLSILFALPLLFLAMAPEALGQDHVFEGRLDSDYDAETLPVFEIDADGHRPEAARQLLATVAASLGARGPSGETLAELRSRTPDDRQVWQGAWPEDDDLKFFFDRSAGRLELVREPLQEARVPDQEAAAISQERAAAIARSLIDRLDEAGALRREELDLADLEVQVEKTGIGRVGEPGDLAREWVSGYRFTARRVLNGVPVLGSGVRVVVDARGEVSELGINQRRVHAAVGRAGSLVPAGAAEAVSIDRTPDEAKALLENGLALPAGTTLFVERWGLVYLETAAPQGLVYRPVYLFSATPLTPTPDGITAGRQLVRIVDVRSTAAEVSFDPFENAPTGSHGGDQRPGS